MTADATIFSSEPKQLQLLVIGINHATAGIELRERFAIAPSKQKEALSGLLNVLRECQNNQDAPRPEALILSTCNRTEVVCNAPDAAETVLNWLLSFCGIESIEPSNYFVETGQSAWLHLVKVASGLDSMVMGEPQIFGQLKSAHATALSEGGIRFDFAPMMQHVFSVAKKVRHDTAIGQNPVSVAFAAVSLAQRIYADMAKTRVLLVGAGETIALVARHLREVGVSQMTVANRSQENAQSLASEFAADSVLLSELPSVLSEHDIVISSTASTLPILGKGAVEDALKARRRKPMFMLDLAVPRDVESQVAELQDVYLYTVDDLRGVVDKNVAQREQERSKAEEIISEGLVEYIRALNRRQVKDLVVDYRKSVDASAELELQRAIKLLKAGATAESALEQLARNLSRKVMHHPTVALHEAAARQDREFLDVAQILLGLNTDSDKD